MINEPVQLYEVIRIVEGIPLFLEDHLDRLYRSARLTGMNLLTPGNSLKAMIKDFVTSQKRNTGNIKLSLSFSNLASESACELNFIPHHYPAQEEYTKGVKVGLMVADRPVPNAKIQLADIRDHANQLISDNNYFEVLLVDLEGNITEGSKSNVFFIKNEMLYSAPGDKILQGITRIKILQICAISGIKVIEEAIPVNSLGQYDAAFLTGTSPKVLPIFSVENFVYKTDLPLVFRLQQLYDQLIANYISEMR